MEKIKNAVKAEVKELFNIEIEPELTRPDEQFGDYATNVAMQFAGQLGKKPREIADHLAQKLQSSEGIAKVEVAGPGFINIQLTDEVLARQAFEHKIERPFAGQEILVEFGDPNPLKAMHLGHLYSAIAGDGLARLFEEAGAKVHRLSYHGDVGLHIAKCIWAVQQSLQETGENIDHLAASLSDKNIGELYALGAKSYEEDENSSNSIKQINEHIYKRDDEQINKIYDVLVPKSFEIFDQIFSELGINYEKRYLESESAKIGEELVKQNTGKVFEQSQGAIVFKGERVDLHTRVFITSERLPTYDAKDLGLVELKNRDFPNASQSIVITAHEQAEYFKVMLAALAEINPELSKKTSHISHGFLSLSTGKMSSRSGDVYAANNLLEQVKEEVKSQYPDSQVNQDVYLAAIKYTFLKQRIGGDVVFNIEESVNLHGNSGPYLQYAHARARSILAKSDKQGNPIQFEADERSLARKISEYPEAVKKATQELMPHYVCTYLYELAQNFNHFYEKNRVIGDVREDTRLALVKAYADVLKNGLSLLNIAAPDKM